MFNRLRFVSKWCVAAWFCGAYVGTPAFGEPDPFECRGSSVSTEVAERILGEVQTAYGGIASLESKFIQDSYLAALDVAERSSGTMVYERPGRMRWEYRAPEPQTFVVQDGTVWFHQPRERQMLVDEFRDVLISDIPVAFLMGLGKLSDDFKVSRACAAGETTTLELQPRSAEQGEQLKGFTLLVDAQRLPLGAKVTDVGGNVTGIRFAERRTNRTILPESFRVEVPPGTDVNDQRIRKGA